MINPVIPSNPEAEISILGCIFLDESVIPQIADQILPEDFYDIKNKTIYSSVLSLYSRSEKIDITSIVSEINKNDQLDKCGGYEYISSIADYSYSTINIETYVNLVLDASLKRKTINELNKLAQDGYNGDINAFNYLEQVEKTVFEISKRRRVSQFRTINEVAKCVVNNAEINSKQVGDIIGLDTGFRKLNLLTMGFQPGALIILAARPSMGKSAMAMNLAMNVAAKNKDGKATVAVFSLEMGAEQLVERLIASDSSLPIGSIKHGSFQNSLDWRRFTSSSAKLGELNIYFDDSSNVSLSAIRAKCRKLAAEKGLDFIVIDYLQLIDLEDGSRKNEQEKTSIISRSLKMMARELNVPVLALSQLSREVEKRDEKRPIMADLRSSGSIEQDADIVMFLYREEYYNRATDRKKEADLIVAKNRSGATSEGLAFIFQGEFARFKEKEQE